MVRETVAMDTFANCATVRISILPGCFRAGGRPFLPACFTMPAASSKIVLTEYSSRRKRFLGTVARRARSGLADPSGAQPHLAFEVAIQMLLGQNKSVSRPLEPGAYEGAFQERDDKNCEFFRVQCRPDFPLRLAGTGYIRKETHPVAHRTLGPMT